MIDLSECLCYCNESTDRRESEKTICVVIYQDTIDKTIQEIYCKDCGLQLK